jgi:DNA-binding NtrC family response regulator
MSLNVAVVALDVETIDTLCAEIQRLGLEALTLGSVREALEANVCAIFAEWWEGERLPALLGGLKAAAARPEPIPVVVLVPEGRVMAAARARASGATDVLFCPPEPGEVRAELEDLRKTKDDYGTVDRETFQFVVQQNLVGESPAFRECVRELRLAAAADANVLLIGETGTGKEMFAKSIHHLSRRCGNPYVAVNCASLSANLLESELFGHGKGAFTDAKTARVGRFEAVGAGTLLLDEIGDIEIPLQVKLLRAIEERSFQRVGQNEVVPFHARLICATSVDLGRAVEEKKFRRDLLSRINQFRITLPALRERRMDIPHLVRHFLRKHSRGRQLVLSRSALEILESYDFPMNVRQLENSLIEGLARSGSGSVILPKHLPAEITTLKATAPPAVRIPDGERSPSPAEIMIPQSPALSCPGLVIRVPQDMPYDKAREFVQMEVDKAYLTDLLNKHGGNRSKTAEAARIDRKTLKDRLEAFQDPPEGATDAE